MAKARFHSLDGLRGACALTVVLMHCELMFNSGAIFCHGYLAVDMFFMVSGFVIAASYDARFAAGLTAGRFIAARIRRLAPVYWAGLALCAAAAMLATYYAPVPQPGRIALQGLLAFALIPQPGPQAYPVNFVAWTLAWELLVNIAYAAGLWRFSTARLLAVIVLLLGLAVVESFASPWGWSFGMTGHDIWFGGLRAFPEFLIGALLFRAMRAGLFERLPVMTPLLPVTAWLVIAVIPEIHWPVLDAAIVVVVCPILVALLVRGETHAPGWFGLAGALSYPLYASHLALVSLARGTPLLGLDRHPDPLRAMFAVGLAVGCAWLIHLAVDPARAGLRAVPAKGHLAGFRG